MTRIISLKTIFAEIPFEDGGRGEGITPSRWRSLHTVLVRLEDEGAWSAGEMPSLIFAPQP